MENSSKYKYPILVASLFILLAAISIFINEESIEPRENVNESNTVPFQIIMPADAKLKAAQYVFYPRANFEIIHEDGWENVPTTSVILPGDFIDPVFSLKKKGTGCVFAYVYKDSSLLDNYEQASFGNRVFSAEEQFDSSWYVPPSSVPENFEFEGDGHTARPQEVRVSRYSVSATAAKGPGMFILYDANGASVNNACDTEVSYMLTSVRKKYEVATLDRMAEGLLISTNYNANDLFFIPLGESQPKKIMQLNKEYAVPPHVFKDQIFYTKDKSIYVLDIFSQKDVKRLAIQHASTTNTVVDFQLHKGTLYYLSGQPNCNEYRVTCVTALYEYELITDRVKLLATETNSRDIVSIDSSGEKLNLSWGEGDAGCFWMRTEVYSFKTKEISKGEEFSGCSDDKGYLEEAAKLKEFRNMPFGTTTDYLVLNKGRIELPSEPLKLHGSRNRWQYDF